MGTQYRVVNVTRKEIYDFGLDWNPKYTEAILNKECSMFLLYLMLEPYRKQHLIIINEGNSWDWETEIVLKNYTDKSEEVQKEFIEWLTENEKILEDR